MSGQLTYQQFVVQAEEFFQISKMVGEEWQLIEQLDSCRQQVKYLRKLCYKTLTMTDHENLEEEHMLSNENLAIDDSCVDDNECTTNTNDASSLIICEYNIIYSTSFSVPVLYFYARHQDGQSLSYDEISEVFSSHHRDCMRNNIWTTVTQVEHPIFQNPIFMLHPCKTASMMLQVNSAANSLTSKTGNSCYIIQKMV